MFDNKNNNSIEMDFTVPEFYFDVKIISIDKKMFYFSRFVLIASSEYFRNLLTKQFQEKASDEIVLEYSSEIVLSLLKYLNPWSSKETKEISINSDTVFDLLEISHATEIQELFTECSKFISKNMREICEIQHWSLVANKLIRYRTEINNDFIRAIHTFYFNKFDEIIVDPHLEKVEFDALIIVCGFGVDKYLIILEKWIQYEENMKFIDKFLNIVRHYILNHPNKINQMLQKLSEKITNPESLITIINIMYEIWTKHKPGFLNG